MDLICPFETDWMVKGAVYMTDGLKRGLGDVILKGVSLVTFRCDGELCVGKVNGVHFHFPFTNGFEQ